MDNAASDVPAAPAVPRADPARSGPIPDQGAFSPSSMASTVASTTTTASTVVGKPGAVERVYLEQGSLESSALLDKSSDNNNEAGEADEILLDSSMDEDILPPPSDEIQANVDKALDEYTTALKRRLKMPPYDDSDKAGQAAAGQAAEAVKGDVVLHSL